MDMPGNCFQAKNEITSFRENNRFNFFVKNTIPFIFISLFFKAIMYLVEKSFCRSWKYLDNYSAKNTAWFTNWFPGSRCLWGNSNFIHSTYNWRVDAQHSITASSFWVLFSLSFFERRKSFNNNKKKLTQYVNFY